MEHGIYTYTDKARDQYMDFEEVLESGEYECILECDSYEEAVEAYEARGYNIDTHWVI